MWGDRERGEGRFIAGEEEGLGFLDDQSGG